MDLTELRNRFEYHAPSQNKALVHESIRNSHWELVQYLNEILPEGGEKSLVITKLEESMFWANASLARHRSN